MIIDLETAECKDLLSTNYSGHLGYISGDIPFVVPITYYYDVQEKSILSYTGNGHKIIAMRKNGNVSLQVENVQSIQDWKSVQVHGTFEEFEGSAAKKHLHRFAQGVQDIIACKKGEKPKFIADFSSRLQEREIPLVYRINITEIIGKIRKTPA